MGLFVRVRLVVPCMVFPNARGRLLILKLFGDGVGVGLRNASRVRCVMLVGCRSRKRGPWDTCMLLHVLTLVVVSSRSPSSPTKRNGPAPGLLAQRNDPAMSQTASPAR